MNKISCEVIGDLLPLYVENMASPSSRALVEEHLKTCEACRALKQSMQREVKWPVDVDTEPLRKIGRQLFQKKVTAVVLAILGTVLLALLMMIHLNSPITIPYEQIADSVAVKTEEDGSVTITMDNPGGSAEFNKEYGEDGELVEYHIRCYTSRWNQIVGKEAGKSTFEVNREEIGEHGAVRVYYYPGEADGWAVLLYESEEVPQNASQGLMIMPRLTLNYYMIFGVLLTVVGAVFCLVLRKNKKRFWIALKLTLLSAVYVVNSLAILSGKGSIYDAEYYFTGILMVTAVVFVIGCWVIDYWRYHAKTVD